MEEYIYNLSRFYPITIRDQSHIDYIEGLKRSFLDNIETCNYQFAFFSYHLLFMGFIYYSIATFRELRQDHFERCLYLFTGNKDKLKLFNQTGKIFDFSHENESTIIRLLSIFNCNKLAINNLKQLIKKRNDIGHCNAKNEFVDYNGLEKELDKYLNIADHIHESLVNIKISNFKGYITDAFSAKFYLNHELDNCEEDDYLSENDVITELNENYIPDNYISENDIEKLKNINLADLTKIPEYENVNKIFCFIVKKWKEEFNLEEK